MRPCSSAATVRTRAAPRPSNRSDVKIVTCASPPTITSICGAPNSPRCSTSQPARRSTALRAAARQVVFAIWHPVTNPTLADAGSPKRSRSHPAATSSTTAAAGDRT